MLTESASLALIHDAMRGQAAPAVVFEDRDLYACVLEYSGDGSRTWKQDLLSGLEDSAVARRAGAVLADFHSHTLWKGSVRNPFRDCAQLQHVALRPHLPRTRRLHYRVKT